MTDNANSVRELTLQGLWRNNPGLVQLLGLCPLLAVTGTVTNALGLGFATMLVLLGSNVVVSLVRNVVPSEIRIPVFVLIIASFVTVIQLLMNAYTFGLYQSLGIFIPLIVTNCAIIGRAEAFASKNAVLPAAIDALMMGLGFMLVLIALGAMREILGQGTLFDGADLLLGEWAASLRIELFALDTQFLLALLPPGAFIGMGLLIALKNLIDARLQQRQNKAVGITRARVTGVAQ
jgi:electron transport complex protein RnfE